MSHFSKLLAAGVIAAKSALAEKCPKDIGKDKSVRFFCKVGDGKPGDAGHFAVLNGHVIGKDKAPLTDGAKAAEDFHVFNPSEVHVDGPAKELKKKADVIAQKKLDALKKAKGKKAEKKVEMEVEKKVKSFLELMGGSDIDPLADLEGQEVCSSGDAKTTEIEFTRNDVDFKCTRMTWHGHHGISGVAIHDDDDSAIVDDDDEESTNEGLLGMGGVWDWVVIIGGILLVVGLIAFFVMKSKGGDDGDDDDDDEDEE